MDGTRPQAFAEAMQPTTRLVWIETPANPLLQLVDVQAVAKIAHDRGAILVADDMRKQSAGDGVHLWGLLEISNHCIRRCGYCGLNAGNRELTRYRMSQEEILACVATAMEYGYGTIVMQAGADRYLLRFETSSPSLYERVHPAGQGQRPGRIALLQILRELGYEIGSGVMIDIPGQSMESLAEDILLFRALDLDMIGVGPFIPHPQTMLGSSKAKTEDLS